MDFGSYYQQHLSEVKWGQNGEGKVRCPFHEDHRPSLSVNRNTGLWYCHSCAEGGTAKQFADRLGVDPPSTSTRGPDAAFVYTDEEGKPLFRSVRWPPKKFHLERYVGPGRWEKGIKGVRRVPYRLHKLVKASGLSYIPEGEKDVHSLERLGLTATTNPMGAGKWRSEYNEFFRGRQVIIPTDNDEPGRQHAHDVARNLHGIAASVKVLEFPDLPEHGDVSDAIARGLTKEQLLARVEQAPEWTPASLPPGRADGQTLGEVWQGLVPPEFHHLRLPPGYTGSGDGLRTAEGHVVTTTPMFPLRQIHDADTKARAFEVLLIERDKATRLRVPAQDLRDHRRIISLAAQGLDVSSVTGRDLVKFLTAYTRINPLESVWETRRLGWTNSEAGRAYILHAVQPPSARIQFTPDTEEGRELLDGLRPMGTLDGVKEIVTAIAEFPIVVTTLIAAVAPAVREILELDVKNFWVHLEGPSTSGKTITQQVGLSAWADPFNRAWLSHGHATYAGVEKLCQRTFGLPVVLEDAHLIREQDVPNLVMAVGNESWKGRGGDRARAQIPWHGVMLTSGELGLLDETSLEGVGARLLTLAGRPFGEVSKQRGEFLNDWLIPALRTHHAVLAPALITSLQAEEGKRSERTRWWAGCRDKFVKEAADNSILNRQAPVWALLALTARLIEEILDLPFETSLQERIWDAFAQAKKNPAPDPVRHAYEYVMAYADSRRTFFHLRTRVGTQAPDTPLPADLPLGAEGIGDYETSPKEGREVLGLINERKGWIGFFPNVLRDVLTRANLGSVQRFLRAWRDRGWLVAQGTDLLHNVKIAGRVIRLYTLRMPVVDDATGDRGEPGHGAGDV
jgi:hypothetical protein